MLNDIKSRLGIDAAVTVYDEELASLIKAAADDILAAGVPSSLVGDPEAAYAGADDRVIMCMVFFIKASYGDDRTNTDKYMDLYRRMVFRLMLEEGDA